MSKKPDPLDIIESIAAEFLFSSDAGVLAALSELPPLVDETNSAWQSVDYWESITYRCPALAELRSDDCHGPLP